MQSLTRMEWLKKQIKELEITNSEFKDQIEKMSEIAPEVYNEFQAWTPLKLILLNYSLDVCTKIVNKAFIFKNKYFIDLFAGSGINKIKDSEDFLIGSPLIASLKYFNGYDCLYFCEADKKLFSALESRVSSLKRENLKIKKEDCNVLLDQIIEEIEGDLNYAFFFIDPHCMEFNWENMKKVLALRSDIIFTFMSSEINRALGYAQSGLGGDKRLTNFFGNNSWKKANDAEELLNIYKDNILKERPNAIIKTIKIQSTKFNFYYYLFFITNETKNKNPWLKAIDKAKTEIESNSDEAIKMALDIVKRRQTELSAFDKSKL